MAKIDRVQLCRSDPTQGLIPAVHGLHQISLRQILTCFGFDTDSTGKADNACVIECEVSACDSSAAILEGERVGAANQRLYR